MVLPFRYLPSSPLCMGEKERRYNEWPKTGKRLIWCFGHRRRGWSGKFRDEVLMNESPGTISPTDYQLATQNYSSFFLIIPFSFSIFWFNSCIFFACPHFIYFPHFIHAILLVHFFFTNLQLLIFCFVLLYFSPHSNLNFQVFLVQILL